MTTKKVLCCAVYTRKSSDEGLEQSFNSLDAQRGAGEAYIASQAHEGWTLVPTRYDDGGFSGGTMERPGLQQLLADIAEGRIDVVVVYKIDRLTRSLSDFSRIVEVFEQAGTSFVSVTQSFNTTDSMGRLMLNVLLSFAQFEREVTGERIRDKIAASKARGMWMGGVLPLGYDRPLAGTRTLQVNEEEARTVRHIFARYLEHGSVHALQRELAAAGIRSKKHVTLKGRIIGGQEFSRGALFHLLRNRTYRGQIVHKDEVHEGAHEAIVDAQLFERVGNMLDANARRHGGKAAERKANAPLTGKLFDASGEPMSPTFSRGKSGRRYRYYVSALLQQGAMRNEPGIVRRLPAPAIERVIGEAVARWTGRPSPLLNTISSVRLLADGVAVELAAERPGEVVHRLEVSERVLERTGKTLVILLPLALPLHGGRRLIVPSGTASPRPDPKLIAALRKAHRMLYLDRGMPLIETVPRSPYYRKLLRLAFLAPDIQRDILTGRQPASLNLERIMHMRVPITWSRQRAALGWPTSE